MKASNRERCLESLYELIKKIDAERSENDLLDTSSDYYQDFNSKDRIRALLVKLHSYFNGELMLSQRDIDETWNEVRTYLYNSGSNLPIIYNVILACSLDA
jgi:hypothetical protein